MGKGYIDKRMGGRFRDSDSVTVISGATDPAELRQFIQNMFDQSTFDFSQITGSPTTNIALKTYIDSTLDLFLQNNYPSGAVITQEMKDYFDSLIDNLTITWAQITGSPAINQAFIDYLNTLISELSAKIALLVVSEFYTSTIKSYIDQRLSNIQTALETLIQNTVNNELRKYIDQLINLKGESTRLISGSVIWLQNLDFFVSALKYQILNQYVESAETDLTIPANASADPMFALIVADVFGNVSCVLGTPAPAPAFPLINSSTQILITPVYIAGASNVPATDPNGQTGEIVTTVIYDENIEWTTAKTEEAGLTIGFADTTSPAHGTKAIKLSIIGGASTNVKSALITSLENQQGVSRTFADTAADSFFDVPMSELFPDHKTDNTAAGIRHLVYYRIASKTSINAFLRPHIAGDDIPLRVNALTNEAFSVGALAFSANVTNQVTFTNHLIEIPSGSYNLVVEGVTRYDQQYIIGTAGVLRPSAAIMSFSTVAPVACKNGNISLSLKPSAALAASSGLLFELYNGSAKVGSIDMIPGRMYGFNPAVTAYQRVTIPVSDFAPVADQITKLVIRPLNDWPTVNLFIDNIILQTGVQKVAEIDKYVESVTLAEVANQLVLTLKRTGGLAALTAFFGTMAAKTFWTGTAAAYAAIAVKDSNTIYNIEE